MSNTQKLRATQGRKQEAEDFKLVPTEPSPRRGRARVESTTKQSPQAATKRSRQSGSSAAAEASTTRRATAHVAKKAPPTKKTPVKRTGATPMKAPRTGSVRTESVRINFDISPQTHKRIKYLCVEREMTIADWMRELIEVELDKLTRARR